MTFTPAILTGQRTEVQPMSDAAARRLAAMLTDAQRAQIVRLAQIITTPATAAAGTCPAQMPGKNPARG